MDIRNSYSKIYQFMRNTNYIIFLGIYIILSSIIMTLLGASLELLPDENYNIWEIVVRIIFGLPLLLQLLLIYIIYRENRNNRIIMILMMIILLYTIVCGIFSLYDLYFTNPDFGDELLIGVFLSQLLFQITLVVALAICMLFKVVYKEVVLKSVVIIILSVMLIFFISKSFYMSYQALLIALLAICHNPVLILILGNIAKEKLFKKDRHVGL